MSSSSPQAGPVLGLVPSVSLPVCFGQALPCGQCQLSVVWVFVLVVYIVGGWGWGWVCQGCGIAHSGRCATPGEACERAQVCMFVRVLEAEVTRLRPSCAHLRGSVYAQA